MNRLEGKKVVITGAGGGLGRSVCELFGSEGAVLVCQDIDGKAAEAALELGKSKGADGMIWECDVSDSSKINEMFAAASEKFGTVNVLINNAGVETTPGDAHELQGGPDEQMKNMSDEGWQRMMDIHVNGAFYCVRAMLNHLNGEKASIINISSIAGLAGWGPLHYATAKGGLLGLTRSIARFLGPMGVRANAVCPGVIDTPMTRNVPEESIAGLKMLTPAGRIGDPQDIAEACLYFASDASDFVSGQALSPNGGLVIS